MSQSNSQIREAIAEQASEWFIENRRGQLDAEASEQFMAWLQTSPVHVDVYLRIAALAPDLAAAARSTTTPLDALLARAERDNVVSVDAVAPQRRPGPAASRRLRSWVPLATAALVVAAITTLWFMRDGERFGLPRTYTTTYGEQRAQTLPDGSVLHLNMDSAVTVRYSHAERVVTIDRGQAMIEVAHQVQRRFRAQAGAAGVIAVGTQFDVYRRPGAVRITVVEGMVAVYAGASPPPLQGDPFAARSVRLDAGSQVDVTGQVGVARRVNARAAVAWLQRQIAFDGEPLGQVADEFNRYSRVPLEIEGDALRELPVTGAFDAFDTDSFAAFLATLQGVVVERTPARIRVGAVGAAGAEPTAIAH